MYTYIKNNFYKSKVIFDEYPLETLNIERVTVKSIGYESSLIHRTFVNFAFLVH